MAIPKGLADFLEDRVADITMGSWLAALRPTISVQFNALSTISYSRHHFGLADSVAK
jgi:hypothetical protein